MSELTSRYGFDLCFSDKLAPSFMCLFTIVDHWGNVCSSILPTLKPGCLFVIELYEFGYFFKFWIQVPHQTYVVQKFFPILCGLSFQFISYVLGSINILVVMKFDFTYLFFYSCSFIICGLGVISKKPFPCRSLIHFSKLLYMF